jgi:AcrR family transcriptional regulator
MMTQPQGASDRRKEILSAVFRCCVHYGFRRTTMDDIAREAGMGRTALYYHFKNKQEIFVALAEWFHERMLRAAERALASGGSSDAVVLAILEARMPSFFEWVHQSEHGREVAADNSRLAGVVSKDANRKYRRIIAQAIRRAERSGEWKLKRVGMSADEAASYLFDSAEGLMGDENANLTPQDYRRRLRQLVQVCVLAWGGTPRIGLSVV